MMADALLIVHFLIAAFIVCGLPLTWLGFLCEWRWVRNPYFRYLHLGAIAFVALEALVGVACPLTVWEDALRGAARPESCSGCCSTTRRNGSSPRPMSPGRWRRSLR